MTSKAYPSGPKPTPLLGHLLPLRRAPIAFLQRCAREYGDFVPLRLGPRPAFLLSDPALIEEVYVARAPQTHRGPTVTRNRRFFGQGMIAAEGQASRQQRQRLQPALNRDQVGQYAAPMVELTARQIADWRDGEARDIHAEMTRLTLQIIVFALFGERGDEIWERHGDDLHTVFCAVPELLLRRTSSPLLFFPDWFPARLNAQWRGAVAQLDAILYPLIRAYRERGDSERERGGMLGHLAGIGQAGEAEPLTDAYIRDELLTLLFAGHETTANALTWACYALAGESDLQERLAAEIHQALGARLPTADDHPRLPYAEWVVLETLRLYPPSWISGRELTERCEIGPYTVPKGAVTLMSQWILHRDPRYYADPERFQPERWQDGLARCLPRGAYFPFGSGPHRCLGNHFALLEALLCLTTLVQAFRFERVPGQQVSWQPAVTLRPDQPVLLRLQRRHKR